MKTNCVWRSRLLAPLLILVVLGLPVLAKASSTVVVDPLHLSGWSASSSGVTAMGQFANGPGAPPLGFGSYEQSIVTSSDVQRLQTSAFNGTPLANLTTLSYSTYVVRNQDGQAAALKIAVDVNGDGTVYDALTFEPVYQTGADSMLPGAGPIPNQCPGVTNCAGTGVWQTWNALSGGWWSDSGLTSGPPLDTIAHYLSLHPNAKFATNAPSFRIASGGGWSNYDGAFDAVTVGVSNTNTTYDFEAGPVQRLIVTPQELHGWTTRSVGTGTGKFVKGPGSPPGGLLGSFEQSTPAANDRNFLESNALAGHLLSDIHALSYATLTASSGAQAPSLQLYLDLDGDGTYTGQTADDYLTFEPSNQGGSFPMVPGAGSVPNQCGASCTPQNVWKTWDAAHGAWKARSSAGFPGAPFDTLAHYAATHPGARIAAVDTDGAPGLKIASGSSGTSWVGFRGNVDYLQVDGTIYDFEPANLNLDCQSATDDVAAVQAAVDNAPDGATITLKGVCNFATAAAHGGDQVSIAAAAVVIRPGSPVNGLTITSDPSGQATIIGSGLQTAFFVAPGNNGVTISNLKMLNLARPIVVQDTTNTTIGDPNVASVPSAKGLRIIGGVEMDSAILALANDRGFGDVPGTVTVAYGVNGALTTSFSTTGLKLQGFKALGNYITYGPVGIPTTDRDIIAIDVRQKNQGNGQDISIRDNAVGFLSAVFPNFNINAIRVHAHSGDPNYHMQGVVINNNNFGRLEELPNPVADINAGGRAGIVVVRAKDVQVEGNGVRAFLSPTGVPMPGGGIVLSDVTNGDVGANGIVVVAEPSTLHSDLGAVGVVDDINTLFGSPADGLPSSNVVVHDNIVGIVGSSNSTGIGSQRGFVVNGSSDVVVTRNNVEFSLDSAINIGVEVDGPGSASAPGIVSLPRTVTASEFCGNILDGTLDNPNQVRFEGGAASVENSFPGGSLATGNGGCVPKGISIIKSQPVVKVTEDSPTPATYKVALTYRPSAPVTVTLAPDEELSVTPTTMVFTSATWNLPQTASVLAVSDPAIEGGHIGTITHTAASSDAGYNGLSSVLQVVIDDPDVGGVAITPTVVSVTEGGATATYSAVLTSQPAANVTVSVASATNVTVAPASRTFTPLNWNIPQTFTVTAIDDSIRQGTHTGLITHTTTSSNASWNHIPVASVLAIITDNDLPAPPFIASPAGHVCTTSVIFSGTAEPGSTVTITEGSTVLGTAVATGGVWTIGPVTMSGGSHTVSATTTGTDGLVSPATTRTFTVLLTAPSVPVINTPAEGDTLFNQNVTVSGTADPGSSVLVRVGGVAVRGAVADATGAWSTVITFAGGAHAIDAVASNGCHLSAPSPLRNFTVVLPDPPVITLPAEGSLQPASVLVTGTAPDGSTVRLVEAGIELVRGVAVSGGAWATRLRFSEGLHRIVAFADTATASSVASAPRTFRVDATPPSVTIFHPTPYILLHAYEPFLESSAIRGWAKDNIGVARIQLSYAPLLPLPGASVTANATCSGCPGPDVTWSDQSPLIPGIYIVTAIAYDLVGNASPSQSMTFLILVST